ncbi:hypothetical protein [Clostridium sp. AM58-1XD]|uniref:hypothetical protein n=1 Tax=Clostridium sp. AM58-1XD TaxID=2292307 RepID=UPI000E4B6D1B|nr:hypothetical protein [Clostridium sp. AM58-1XD]RGY96644.1 hypothetical protein DXA13_16580 [Clostridium sp. AM58-1XD]
MMKKIYRTGAALLMILLLAGCSSKKAETEPETDPADQAYPITIGDTEIVVGETSVGTLLDAGFMITVSDMDSQKNITVYEIDPAQELEANSYYTGGTLRKDDIIYGNISIITVEAGPMGDAVVARLELDGYDFDKSAVKFAGVPLNELTNEKVQEVAEGLTGDEYMQFYKGDEYEVFFGFDTEGGLTKVSMEKKYDIDWTKKE